MTPARRQQITMKPKRIQLKRMKGWKKPEGAVVVSRPTKWGNPFRVFGQDEYLFCDASHRRKIFTPWVVFDHDQDIRGNPATTAMAIEHFRRWVLGEIQAGVVKPCPFTLDDIWRELRGKDLACWCKEGDPCHGSVLLEIANS